MVTGAVGVSQSQDGNGRIPAFVGTEKDFLTGRFAAFIFILGVQRGGFIRDGLVSDFAIYAGAAAEQPRGHMVTKFEVCRVDFGFVSQGIQRLPSHIVIDRLIGYLV